MNNLKITELNGKSVIGSREVAEMIEVTHANLLKKIRAYEDILTKSKLTSLDFLFQMSIRIRRVKLENVTY